MRCLEAQHGKLIDFAKHVFLKWEEKNLPCQAEFVS